MKLQEGIEFIDRNRDKALLALYPKGKTSFFLAFNPCDFVPGEMDMTEEDLYVAVEVDTDFGDWDGETELYDMPHQMDELLESCPYATEVEFTEIDRSLRIEFLETTWEYKMEVLAENKFPQGK